MLHVKYSKCFKYFYERVQIHSSFYTHDLSYLGHYIHFSRNVLLTWATACELLKSILDKQKAEGDMLLNYTYPLKA